MRRAVDGHLLIAPVRHIPDLDDASDEELLELTKLTRDCKIVLKEAIAPHGFNIGINFGRCAGAGLPEHMHIHLVPRWDGFEEYEGWLNMYEKPDRMADIFKKELN